MILQETSKEGEAVCSIGFFDGGTDSVLYILGDTFQRNVVSVFDVGAVEMRFAPREFYPNNDPVKD
jgi:Eukaryotic aspartyl protease